MLDDLLPYYQQELTYLRQLSKEFAAQYPKIAGRLLLEGEACKDPHVERLIEAFAFLAARIHRKLDDEFPEITDALLGVLYPHLLRPIPSMSIVQFHIDLDETPLTGRYTIPRHASLSSRKVNGMPCCFRTCYPLYLWPIRIIDAKVEPLERSAFSYRASDAVAVVRMRFACIGDLTFAQLGIDRLRLFLDGESSLMHALYELLFNNAQQIVVATGSSAKDVKLTLPKDSLLPVGFAEDESVLDYDPRSFLGYRLLHEHFTFPDKFLFFDVVNLDQAARAGFGKEMEVAIFLSEFEHVDRLPRLAQTVATNTFRLGCSPVVNLFRRTAEPIRVTHEQTEYRVVPDVRRIWGTEVYSIDSVRKVVQSRDNEEVIEYQPFYSVKHAYQQERHSTFWYASRKPSAMKDDAGTDMYLSLVDLDFNPAVPTTETLSVSLTCTNRDLPSQLPFGGQENDFEIEGNALISRIHCLRKPTPTLRPPLGRGAQWRLISHLSLNHLSIVEDGREALLEILSLYDFSGSSVVRRQISGITKVASRPTISRVGFAQKTAFVRGTEVSLEFDEEQYVGSGVFLFATILERFLGLYCAANSFTQLQVTTKQRERVLRKWPARAGDAILL